MVEAGDSNLCVYGETMKAEKPQNGKLITWKNIFVVLVVVVVLHVLAGSASQIFSMKPDGELWITQNGSRVKTMYYGHYEIQCLCKYLIELKHKCSDRFMGCGAVNCECYGYSNDLKNDLILWRTGHSGTFVRGEGLVCT